MSDDRSAGAAILAVEPSFRPLFLSNFVQLASQSQPCPSQCPLVPQCTDARSVRTWALVRRGQLTSEFPARIIDSSAIRDANAGAPCAKRHALFASEHPIRWS